MSYRIKERYFFVSEGPREPSHVESEENCEIMLCGKVIPVEGPRGGAGPMIQTWWGPKKCADCFLLFGKKTGRLVP